MISVLNENGYTHTRTTLAHTHAAVCVPREIFFQVFLTPVRYSKFHLTNLFENPFV